MIRKPIRLSTVCLLLLVGQVLAGIRSSQALQDDGQYFPETGYSVKGRFLQYWRENGSLAQQGYPISGEVQEESEIDGKTYTMQYFERAVFELHPEKQQPYDVLLSLLGTLQYTRKYSSVGVPDQKASTDNPLLFPETGKALGGKFRRYWETHGGLAQQGFPISNEFQQESDLDGKTYTVQYFERAVFELHPENAGTEYEVLLSQLGKLEYDRQHAQVSAASTPPPAPTAGVPADVADWLRGHAIPLTTVEPNDDFSDLMPLKEIIGDARIVELGEAVHGGHEFQTMKHRLLRFLVKEMGFTMFAIEDGWVESFGVNDYIEHGQGTAEGAARRFPIVFWNTKEMADMLRWMRSYNDSRGSSPALSFNGFDMQASYLAFQIVYGYLQSVDATAAARAFESYQCFQDFADYYAVAPSERAKCRAGLQAVYDNLTVNQQKYEAASSHEAFAQAQFGARIVLQAEERGSDRVTAFTVRDRSMAENIGWLLDQGGPNAKMVVWAHNGHVANYSIPSVPRYSSMGAHLKAKYGDAVRIIGFDFYNGSFNARDVPPSVMRVFTVSAAPGGSYSQYFHSANLPVFALDLRGITYGRSATDWLVGPRDLWSVGSLFNDAHPDEMVLRVSLPQYFDAVIHIDHITPTRFLR